MCLRIGVEAYSQRGEPNMSGSLVCRQHIQRSKLSPEPEGVAVDLLSEVLAIRHGH